MRHVEEYRHGRVCIIISLRASVRFRSHGSLGAGFSRVGISYWPGRILGSDHCYLIVVVSVDELWCKLQICLFVCLFNVDFECSFWQCAVFRRFLIRFVYPVH